MPANPLQTALIQTYVSKSPYTVLSKNSMFSMVMEPSNRLPVSAKTRIANVNNVA